MAKTEVSGGSEFSQAFPGLAPLLDVWFNSRIGHDNVRQPWNSSDLIRLMLWDKTEALKGSRPNGTPGQLVTEARGLIESVLELASSNEIISHIHWLAAREAINGQPLTADLLLRGEPESSTKRKILATAELVYALNSGVLPKNAQVQITVDGNGLPRIVGQEPPGNAQDAMMHLNAGLTLLGQELALEANHQI